jgi:hypothetical protein
MQPTVHLVEAQEAEQHGAAGEEGGDRDDDIEPRRHANGRQGGSETAAAGA